MTPEQQAAFASAFAAAMSAAAALVALFVAWGQKRVQGKSADFSNCLEIVGRLTVAQERVFSASDEPTRQFEFRDLLNLLEALAFLYNKNKIAPATKTFTAKFLDQAIAWIYVDEGMRKLMKESVTSEDTYGELHRYKERRRLDVVELQQRYVKERGVQQ